MKTLNLHLNLYAPFIFTASASFSLWGLNFVRIPYQSFFIHGLSGFLFLMLLWMGYALFYHHKQLAILAQGTRAEDLGDVNSFSLWMKPLHRVRLLQMQKIKQATVLIHEMAAGKSIDCTEQDDELTQSIQNLNTQLAAFRTQEERRRWAAEGHAHFAGILRQNHDQLRQFSNVLVSHIVKYVSANQAVLFVKQTEDGHEVLEASGAYAFGRQKLVNKKIEKGEGLVGQAWIEQDSVFLTEIPEDYVHITSGLGTSPPRNIVIIPLVYNDEIMGVLELASFQVLDNYQITFLKELGQSIAAALSSIQVNLTTKKLLDNAQKLAAELQSNEEEMRQNMEELTATQEEMSRKQLELDGVLKAIDTSMLMAEFDQEGNLIQANEQLLKLLRWDKTRVNSHRQITKDAYIHDDIWDVVKSGNSITKEFAAIDSQDNSGWISATYAPVFDVSGKLYKVILIGQDISERKKQEQEHQRLSLVANNTDNAVIITNKSGEVEYVNPGFTKMTGYELKEIIGKKPGQFLQGEDTNQATVQIIREKLKRKEPVYEEILNYDKWGKSYWVSIAINPVFDEKGELEKFISVQADITATKEAALDAKYKLEAISRSNAVLEMDSHGKILKANSNFLEIFGYSQEDLLGNHHHQLVSEEEKNSQVYQALWEKLTLGEYVADEFIRITKSGEIRYLRGVYNPIFDLNGKPQKIVKFATDITPQKKLEQENQKQEVEIKHYLESINNTIASLTFDKVGNIIDANAIYQSVTGFKLEDIQGKSYFDLLPEADRFMPQVQLMWESLKEGKFFSGEFKQLDSHGHEIWSTGTINPIYDINNKVNKIMLLAHFTTKEKEKLQELSSSLNALKSIVPILELSSDFEVKSANKLFMDSTGHSRMSLKKIDFDQCIHLAENISKTRIINQLQADELVDTTIKFSCEDQHDIESRVFFAPVFNLDQKLDKIMIVFTGKMAKRKGQQNMTG